MSFYPLMTSRNEGDFMTKKSKNIAIVVIVIFAAIGGWFLFGKSEPEQGDAKEVDFVDAFFEERKRVLDQTEEEDPFGEDDLVRILLIGLDSRVQEEHGHCDAIQFVEINKNSKSVTITAIPRGTYSPLPYEPGLDPSDYYVSNACEKGGLAYGIQQIERIVGKQADYVATIGFSGLIGLLRQVELPTTDTLRWLRHRQGYAIGEPQRAHNHSTFIKQMLGKFIPDEHSKLDIPFQFMVYQFIKTDLSFEQSREISRVLSEIGVKENPDRITLQMRPEFEVRDISYNADEVQDYLQSMLGPIEHLLNNQDFSDVSLSEVQADLLRLIDDGLSNPEFLDWGYENRIWYQIEDEQTRLEYQFELITTYINSLTDLDEKRDVLQSYFYELEYLGKQEFIDLARMTVDSIDLLLQ